MLRVVEVNEDKNVSHWKMNQLTHQQKEDSETTRKVLTDGDATAPIGREAS